MDNFALRQEYDRVIRCLGFTFDDSLFNRLVEYRESLVAVKGQTFGYPNKQFSWE